MVKTKSIKSYIKNKNILIKSFLENNKIYFDTIFQISISIVSIFLLIQGNYISKSQVLLEKQEVAPAFNFSFQKNKNNIVTYHMHNNKGYISNVVFEKFNVITILFKNKSFEFEIYDTNFQYTSRQNDWYFTTEYKENFYEDIISKINNWINKQKYLYIFISYDSLYKVKYTDYQNKYYEDYFYINNDGSGEYIANLNTQSNNLINRYSFQINSNEDDSNKIANIIISYLQIFYKTNQKSLK